MDPRIALLQHSIRDVPDFPKPGIVFKDITPLLSSRQAFHTALELLLEHYRPLQLDSVIAVESRGFIFGGALAHTLGVGLHVVRKPGKLPCKADRVTYSLEYGSDALELHQDSLRSGERVIVFDDLLATGGTARAAAQLAANQGAKVLECGFVIELAFLQGRARIAPIPCFSLLSYA